MEWIEIAAEILAGWLALSLILAASWSRFMAHLRWTERERSAAASARRLDEFSSGRPKKRAS